MKLQKLLLTLLFAVAVSSLSAQDIVVIGGVKYAIHDVAKGETLYSLARQYGVTIEDIKSANEVLASGLKAGQRIKIPVKDAVAPVAEPRAEVTTTETLTHKVAKRETLYSISKRYDVTIEELYALNPHIQKGLKAGQIITIPLKRVAPQPNPVPVPAPAPTPVKEELADERVATASTKQQDATDS